MTEWCRFCSKQMKVVDGKCARCRKEIKFAHRASISVLKKFIQENREVVVEAPKVERNPESPKPAEIIYKSKEEIIDVQKLLDM